jgi:hypothetical protein
MKSEYAVRGCRKESVFPLRYCSAGKGISYAVMIGKVAGALKGVRWIRRDRDFCALILGKQQ